MVDFEGQCAEEYSDGSRAVGSLVTAAATRSESLLFGQYATVMDAEEVGVMLVWKGADSAALDSQGAITRISQLRYVRGLRRNYRRWPKGHGG